MMKQLFIFLCFIFVGCFAPLQPGDAFKPSDIYPISQASFPLSHSTRFHFRGDWWECFQFNEERLCMTLDSAWTVGGAGSTYILVKDDRVVDTLTMAEANEYASQKMPEIEEEKKRIKAEKERIEKEATAKKNEELAAIVARDVTYVETQQLKKEVDACVQGMLSEDPGVSEIGASLFCYCMAYEISSAHNIPQRVKDEYFSSLREGRRVRGTIASAMLTRAIVTCLDPGDRRK
jgi:hypothetical protein